ncbi:MAG: hypothetical protein ACOX9C_02725 [Kiritimatiellia bacterium]|jgi:autotransporter-associated beta strand protein
MSTFHRKRATASPSVSTAPTPRRRSAPRFAILHVLAMAGVLAFAASDARALSATWISTSSSDWSVGTNWSGAVAPGSVTNLSTDTARFRGASCQLTVLPDANRSVGYVEFDQVAPGNAGNYILGAVDGHALHMGRTDGAGHFQVGGGLTTPDTTTTIICPLVLHGSYQFINNSLEPTVALVLASDISNGSAGNTDVQLKGLSTGYNRVSGTIREGAATASLTKLNPGTWYVTGTNNTYTKNTTVSQGTLIAGANVPASGPGPFGDSSAAVFVGNPTRFAVGDATLLVGDGTNGFTMARPITIQALTTGMAQTVGIGGANTAGVSYVTGNLSLNRDVFLQCATGGTVVFQTGTWTTRDKVFTIGREDCLGCVKIANDLGTAGGVTVAYGTLEVAGTITAPTSVNDGATLSGTGTIVGNVVLADNATCAPGTNGAGTLAVDGAATFQPGSRFAVNVGSNGTASKLTASDAISLDDVVLDVTSPEGFAGTVVIAHADTALTGTFSASSPLPPFCSIVYTANEAKLRFTTGTLIAIQ